jgi:hypothetical protein
MNDKDIYIQTWRDLFTHLLAWSPRKFDGWLKDAVARRGMDREDSMVYHEQPQYWFALDLVRELLPNVSTRDINRIQRSVSDILGDAQTPVLSSAQWQAFRRDINAILFPFGGSLPVPTSKTAHASLATSNRL